jgi:hypothetical protein
MTLEMQLEQRIHCNYLVTRLWQIETYEQSYLAVSQPYDEAANFIEQPIMRP